MTDSLVFDKEIGYECGLDSSGSGYEPVAGPCKYGNET
jgi:hypothetical protein